MLFLHWGGLMCFMATSRANSCGWPTHRCGIATTQLYSRGHAAKEEKLKSLLTVAQEMNWHPCDCPCKLIAYRRSKWTMNALAIKMQIALSFSIWGLCGHIHMRVGPGQSQSCPHNTNSRFRSMIFAILRLDFNWIYTGGLVKIAPERHEDQVFLPAYPWLRWSWD